MKRNYDLAIKNGDILELRLKSGKGTYYFTRNDELIKILDEWRLSMFVDKDGALMCNCWKWRKSGVRNCSLSDIAYACYSDKIHSATLVEDIRRFRNWKKCSSSKGEIQIDHMDSNRHNNTERNLAPMLGKLNRVKHDVTARFLPPYYLTSAYCDGEYRVDLMYLTIEGKITTEIGVRRYLCEDDKSYVACLKWLYDTRHEWYSLDASPREYQLTNKDGICRHTDIDYSTHMQRRLAQLERKKFVPYKSDKQQK